jgi:hypothetical protein
LVGVKLPKGPPPVSKSFSNCQPNNREINGRWHPWTLPFRRAWIYHRMVSPSWGWLLRIRWGLRDVSIVRFIGIMGWGLSLLGELNRELVTFIGSKQRVESSRELAE